jgi:hypothetical protein
LFINTLERKREDPPMYIDILNAVTLIQFNYFLPVAFILRVSKSGVVAHKLNYFLLLKENEFINEGLQRG